MEMFTVEYVDYDHRPIGGLSYNNSTRGRNQVAIEKLPGLKCTAATASTYVNVKKEVLGLSRKAFPQDPQMASVLERLLQGEASVDGWRIVDVHFPSGYFSVTLSDRNDVARGFVLNAAELPEASLKLTFEGEYDQFSVCFGCDRWAWCYYYSATKETTTVLAYPSKDKPVDHWFLRHRQEITW